MTNAIQISGFCFEPSLQSAESWRFEDADRTLVSVSFRWWPGTWKWSSFISVGRIHLNFGWFEMAPEFELGEEAA